VPIIGRKSQHHGWWGGRKPGGTLIRWREKDGRAKNVLQTKPIDTLEKGEEGEARGWGNSGEIKKGGPRVWVTKLRGERGVV